MEQLSVRARWGGVILALAAGTATSLASGPDLAVEGLEAATDAANDARLVEHAEGVAESRGGLMLRNVPAFPGITNGCQLLGTNAFATGPAWRRADNFKPAVNSMITGVSWSGYYRAVTSQAAGSAPAGETFEIRFLADVAGVPGAVVAGPFTVNPTSTEDGTFGAGGPPVYDYVATLPSGVAVTGGECYWLEIRNVATGGQRWFWYGSPISPGDSVHFATGVQDPTFDDFEQITGDLAFCLDIEIQSLVDNPCPIATIPAACSNPDVNGQPRAGSTSGFSSNLPGSTTVSGGGSVSFQRAEAFRLTNGGNIENVCFYAFWNSFGGTAPTLGGGIPANPDLQLTYFNNDPVTGLPGTVLAQYTVGEPGVTLAYDTNGIHRIDHPPVPVAANTCYHISIAYLSQTADPARQARFIWGGSNSTASNTDAVISSRNIATNPPGDWTVTNTSAPIRGLSFLFNVGESVLPSCQPPAPTNITCAAATPLTINGPAVAGNNIGAPYSIIPPCQFDLVYGSIVWYSLVGNGSAVTVSTCNGALFGDPNMNVYCAPDGCDGPLNCIVGNDDLGAGCGSGTLAAGVTFDTVAGQTYYITVHGTGDSSTAFEIAATSSGTPADPPAEPCASFARCENSMLPSDATEPETCVTEQSQNVNRTCDGATPYPALGQTVAGTVSTYLNGTTATRDFDYWILPAVTEPTRITWRLNAEFPAIYRIEEHGAACTTSPTVGPNAVRTACFDEFLGDFELQPGVLTLFLVSTSDFEGLPCPDFNDYRLTIAIAPEGACCVPATVCFVTSPTDCANQEGNYSGDATTCSPDPCTGASGACCAGTTCSVGTQAACSGPNTRYAGDGTTCNAPGNNTTPCCKADYNQNGTVTVQDIFDFLSGYFSQNPQADINGIGGVTVQDIFDFLGAYFGGCA